MRAGALLIDRSDRTRIRFGGARAAELVTGLVTNDVLGLTAGHGQYAAALTPKGKIAADIRIFADQDGLLTDTSARASAGWRDIVTKYVNPRIAPYRDVTAETRDLGVFGPKARKIVATATGADEGALEQLHPYGHVTVGADGTIEAVEWNGDSNWVVGVQWHPERMPEDALAQRLFQDFVAAARAREAVAHG